MPVDSSTFFPPLIVESLSVSHRIDWIGDGSQRCDPQIGTTMKALVVLACLLACPMLDARAEILFSQTEPEQPNAAFSSNDTPSSQKIADNFIIAGPDPAFVRSVRFLGGYISLNPSPGTVPSDRFRITFYEGTADGPGAPLAEADILAGAAVLRQPTGGVDLNGTDEPFE